MSATDATATIKDDLATEILRRRRRQMPRLTAALAAAVLIGIGIVGGVQIQKHWGSSSSGSGGSGLAAGNASSLRAAFQSRFGGTSTTGARGSTSRTGAGSGAVGGFGGFGGGASGTVTLIKGSNLYVTESTGNTVIVHTSAGSRVTKTVAGSVKTIHPGDVVSVNGTQAANGSWTARSISLTPSTSTSNG